MTSALRVRRHRERQAAGLVTLQITVPEDELVTTLRAARQLDGIVEPKRADLERGIEQLLELLHRA